MPKRYGLFRQLGNPKSGVTLNREQAGGFYYGIWQVFEALRAGPFLTGAQDRERAARLLTHFTQVVGRFLYSLQHLNTLMQRTAESYSEPVNSPALVGIHLEAGCHADHVLTYLNTIVDDIAQLIILATGVTPKQRIESMGNLKKPDVLNLPDLAPVAVCLKHLNTARSWWDLAFRPRHGARQLLIHNQFIVTFQGTQAEGMPIEAQAHLVSAYQQHALGGDFFALLREILLDLCNWLDALEGDLVAHLSMKDSTWKPLAYCPSILLGLGVPATGVVYHPQYYPLPLCDQADPLPWEFGPPVLSS
jgi:hypothetical protein